MKFKRLLVMACVLCLSACSTVSQKNDQPVKSADKPNEEFSEYLDEYVTKVAQNDYSTMHHLFIDPENYGIDPSKVKVTLGSVTPTQEDLDLENELKEELNTFTYESLDKTQQNIYDQLQWDFELSEKSNDEKYKYLDNLWSTFNGTQQVLVQFFSEYELRKEEDIAPMIELINDVPRYVKDTLDFSKEQAEKDMLMFDYDAVMDDCKQVLDNKDNSAVESELNIEIDSLNLKEEDAKKYKEQVKEALDKSFYPGYETMEKGLKELKDDVLPMQGLASLPNGKEYYQLLAQAATGSKEDVAKMKDNMNTAVNNASDSLYELSLKNDDVFSAGEFIETDFKSVDEIMSYLQDHYSSLFPKVETMEYNLQPLADDQSNEGIVAYFLVPAVDSNATYQIRYNKRDYGDDPTSLSLYQTLAHEGIPGHMYQAQYNKEHFKYTIQYLLSNIGFTEGYATYVETQSLKFLDLDETVLKSYNLLEVLNNFTVVSMDIDINYYGMSYKEFQEIYGTGLKDLYNQLAGNPTAFLSYYYGFYLINEMRNDAQEKMKGDFSDVDFNNALLESGEVNFDIIKKNVDQYTSQVNV